jgi:hypothetical protein
MGFGKPPHQIDRPDKTEYLIMQTLQNRWAVVERKYVIGRKEPKYVILMDFPDYKAAVDVKARMR